MASNKPDASSFEALPQLQVVVHAGPLAGKGFLFSGEAISFGRDSDNDISWEDTRVSRFHAKITRQGERLILEDLGSTNGTLVNGKPITGRHILQPADIISIGSSVFGVKGFAAPQTVSITQVSLKLSEQAAQAAQQTVRPPQPAPRPQPKPVAAPPAKAANSGLNLITIVGVMGVIALILGLAAITAYFLFMERTTPQTSRPAVVITAPVNGSQVPVGQPTGVQVTASDPAGIVRLELWVSGQKVQEAASPAAQGQPTLTAAMQWTPPAPGSYTLEIKAYNTQNRVNVPASVAITAGAAVTTTVVVTGTPQTPTATVPSTPAITAKTDLNVRLGPEMFYDLVGLLPAGASAEITAKSEDGQWWQIKFSPASSGFGWVTANPEFSTAANTSNLPIAQAPPTPTGTPTLLPTSTPTVPPTHTPVPSTATPTPTPTATPGAQFSVTPTSIEGGQCVQVAWNVTGVKEVYYQDQGVSGTDKRTECPASTTTYVLRVVKQDNTEQTEKITVEVSQPVISSGKKKLSLGETIDLDQGAIPGDDFTWRHDDDKRYFEVLNDVKIAPKGVANSLEGLSLDTCKNANYGKFTYLDGSDVILDPDNELTDGRVACYVTTQGHFGKLRFPKFSTGDITVEWLTWR